MKLKKVSTTLTSGGWQAYDGPGVLLYAVMDGTSLSSNVLTLYDGHAATSAQPTIATWTQDTDFGTTVPVACFKDGNIVATIGTASANTHFGVPFTKGLYIDKTGDTTHPAAITLIIKPLHAKVVNLGGKGAATDSVGIWDGPGILHAIRITTDQADATLGTADLTFKDSAIGGSGNTLWTGTNYVTAGPANIAATTTTGIDDAGSAVTTAATGSYTNPGIAFLSGLNANLAGANTGAGVRTYQIHALIEA